ncbi:DUF481 domain-containing protein [Kiritimatiellota bacterium B12222]|nr:DUF481 domain-containing protein [Kiritimatiellota bacterium B12222]
MIYKISFFLVSLFSVATLQAQLTAGFETNLNFGLAYNSGNTNSSDLDFGFDSKRIKENHELIIAGSYEYGQQEQTDDEGNDSRETNLDRSKIEAQSNWLISNMTYSFININGERDEKADIEYRVNAGPGLGYYFYRNDDRTLSTEGSVVYLMESVSDEESEYFAFRLGQKFEQKLGDNAKIWQAFEGVLQFDDTDNFYINFEVGAEASLTERLGLRVVAKDKYNNAPAADVEKNDFTLITGISLKI